MKKWKNSWKSPEYNAWIHMIHRCENPNDKAFKHYGAKGVQVCERWRHDFDAFYEDLGPRPSKEFSLDRIDVDGHYEPLNCKWSTRVEQANNKRHNRRLSFRGQMLTVREIAEQTGIPVRTIRSRVDHGMDEERLASPTPHIRSTWEHGTLYGYVQKKCRCDQCRQAKSIYSKGKK